MRTIAIMNQKGGVGKTTTSVNLSAALAAAGKKVQLIDLDPQAHASLHLGLTFENEFDSVYDVLVKDVALNAVRRQVQDNLWLVPAHLDLAAADFELASVLGREKILADKIAEDNMEFDYIIVDCPPSLGVLTLNALVAVEEVVIPLQPHFLALHGLSKLLETIELVAKRLNSKLRVSGVALCLYDGHTTLANDVPRDVRTHGATSLSSTRTFAAISGLPKRQAMVSRSSTMILNRTARKITARWLRKSSIWNESVPEDQN